MKLDRIYLVRNERGEYLVWDERGPAWGDDTQFGDSLVASLDYDSVEYWAEDSALGDAEDPVKYSVAEFVPVSVLARAIELENALDQSVKLNGELKAQIEAIKRRASELGKDGV